MLFNGACYTSNYLPMVVLRLQLRYNCSPSTDTLLHPHTPLWQHLPEANKRVLDFVKLEPQDVDLWKRLHNSTGTECIQKEKEDDRLAQFVMHQCALQLLKDSLYF